MKSARFFLFRKVVAGTVVQIVHDRWLEYATWKCMYITI